MKDIKIPLKLGRLHPVKTMRAAPVPVALAKPSGDKKAAIVPAPATTQSPAPVPTIAVDCLLIVAGGPLRGQVQLKFTDQPEVLAMLDSATDFTITLTPTVKAG